MKKILALLCALVMIFACAACDNSNSGASNNETPDTSTDSGNGGTNPDGEQGDKDPDGGNQGDDKDPDEGQGGEGGDKDPDEGQGSDKNPEDLKGKALSIVKEFWNARLNVWQFLPEALSLENMESHASPSDFSTFVQTSEIGNKFIGKQLNVVYEVLSRTETLAKHVENVMAAQDVIVDLYQAFINDNPDNYASFEKNTEHFDFKIELTETENTLLVRFTTVAVEIGYQNGTGESTVRVQLSDSNVIKYETSQTRFKAALDVLNVAKWQVEFEQNDDGSADGDLYEFFGAKGHYLKTVARIHTDSEMTYVLADKRESDDLKIEGYLEAYNSQTGEYLGAEVKETVKLFDYDTLWLPLSDISGITSVKKTDEQNGLNEDTIYINGNREPIKTKNVSITKPSRRYDIEFKEVWLVTRDAEGNLERQKTEIPMLFVQAENYETLAEDFEEKNNVAIEVLHGATHAAVQDAYALEVENYIEMKANASVDEIDAYIGAKNSFFD